MEPAASSSDLQLTPTAAWLDVPEISWQPVSEGTSKPPSRRTFLLGSVGAIAGSIAATTLGVFGRVAPASASGPGLRLNPTRNVYGSGVGSPCWSDQGCFGPAADHIDSFYCSSCSDYQADNFNWIGFHYTGYRYINGTYYYYADDPDRFCAGDYDYWIHDGTPCGYCPYSLRYRCHDGYKADSAGNHFTICHSIAICNEVHQSTSC